VDCPQCERLLGEYSETAGRLAFALAPVPLSAGAEDRLMAAARDIAASPGPAGILEPQPPPSSVTPGPFPEHRDRSPRVPARRWAGLAAVAAAVAVLAGFVGHVIAPGSPTLRTVALRGVRGQELALVFESGSRQAVLVGSHIAVPPDGRVYELWYQPERGAPMAPAGTFVPHSGRVLLPARVGPSFVLVAVSVEPPGGSEQPTTQPVFVGST